MEGIGMQIQSTWDAENSVISTLAFQDPSLSDVIPYMTARIFPSEATYKFPVNYISVTGLGSIFIRRPTAISVL
jgi:hypothetical protein